MLVFRRDWWDKMFDPEFTFMIKNIPNVFIFKKQKAMISNSYPNTCIKKKQDLQNEETESNNAIQSVS